jgi:hypothetical protein
MDERSLRWQQRLEWPMVIEALLVIPLLVVEESDAPEPLGYGGSSSMGGRGWRSSPRRS